jgi:ankyrin repeat protein
VHGDAVASFVAAATSRRRDRAEGLLEAHPQIADDPWAALVLGRGWDGDPNEPGGPLDWAPLLYVCHSCFASLDLALGLIERGADPNAFFTNEYGQMSALYGAAGVLHDPELTGLLLTAGADPDDGESVYHATEAEGPECLRLLLEAGAATRGTNALGHALDEDRLEHVRLLLEAGADPNEGPILAHAVRRGRGPETLRLLVEHGADVDRPGGELWRGDVPLRTPYQHAVLRGRPDDAEVLEGLGASTEVAPDDLAIAAVARGERPEGDLPEDLDPDAQEVLVLAALHGSAGLVLELVGPEFRGVVGGSPAGTLLHHAAWVGDAELVGDLLAAGIPADAGSGAEFDTPLAWAALASCEHHVLGRDYVGVAERLTAAGAQVDRRFVEVAGGPLLPWLEARANG